MKAVTIPQPWASLLFADRRRIETSWWAMNYAGRVAIHAGRTPFTGESNFRHEFITLAAAAWGTEKDAVLAQIGKLPLGAVIGEAELTDCRLIHRARYVHGGRAEVFLDGDGGGGRLIVGLDAALGNFNPGRYAVFFERPELYAEPIPWPGRKGLWEWERPA